MNRIALAGLTAAAVLVLTAAGYAAVVESTADAQTVPPASGEKLVSATGVATASVEPDLLAVTFGVKTKQETAKAAFAANSESMNKVVDAVVALGISKDDLSTSSLRVYPEYEGYRDGNDRYREEFVGYVVTNTLTVRTAMLDSAADIIDGAIGAGANRVDGVHFTLSPKTHEAIRDDLLEKAVLNAREKASNALAPLGHEITGVKSVSLSEFGMGPPGVYPEFKAAFASQSLSADSAPIFSSEQDVRTAVNVVFLMGGSGTGSNNNNSSGS